MLYHNKIQSFISDWNSTSSIKNNFVLIIFGWVKIARKSLYLSPYVSIRQTTNNFWINPKSLMSLEIYCNLFINIIHIFWSRISYCLTVQSFRNNSWFRQKRTGDKRVFTSTNFCLVLRPPRRYINNCSF
jgi:hypothetical protein